MNNKVKIIIATHKQYKMPKDTIYLPLQVGSYFSTVDLGYMKDNTGINISSKNRSFCELTGLYWGWNNLNYEYIGLVHYRRYFTMKKNNKNPFNNILSGDELNDLLQAYDIIVPKKRKYYIETLASHYANTHYKEHLDITREIIKEKYPEYLISYDKTVGKTYGYMFNMMIMKKDLLDNYCKWLFSILFELEKRVVNMNLSEFQGRFYGRVSEIIFNVWLNYQIDQGIINKNRIKELPFIYTEKIDKKRKIIAFLKAKFFHEKYEKSF